MIKKLEDEDKTKTRKNISLLRFSETKKYLIGMTIASIIRLTISLVILLIQMNNCTVVIGGITYGNTGCTPVQYYINL
jgi:hypothetical protein